MSGMRLVDGDVIQHAFEGGDQRRQFGKAGKDRTISDIADKQKSWSLCDLQSVKLGRV